MQLVSLTMLTGSLRRVTQPGAYIPQIDGLRFLAIALVVIFHIAVFVQNNTPSLAGVSVTELPVLFQVALTGFIGVELFFVISGFILSLRFANQYLLNKKEVEIKRYFWKRITRIEPPYIISLILLTVFILLLNNETPADIIPRFFASLFYVQSFLFPESPDMINIVNWSLAIEVQFYIVAPFLAWLIFAHVKNHTIRRTMQVVLIIATGLLSMQPFMQQAPTNLLQHLHYFLAGFLLADFYVLKSIKRTDIAWAWDMLCALCLLMVLNIAYMTKLDKSLMYLTLSSPFLIMLMYIAVFQGNIVNRLFRVSWVAIIGGMAYTIYLYHNPIISALGRFTVRMGEADMNASMMLVTQIVILTIPIMIFSLLHFALIERPCMNPNWVSNLITRIRRGDWLPRQLTSTASTPIKPV